MKKKCYLNKKRKRRKNVWAKVKLCDSLGHNRAPTLRCFDFFFYSCCFVSFFVLFWVVFFFCFVLLLNFFPGRLQRPRAEVRGQENEWDQDAKYIKSNERIFKIVHICYYLYTENISNVTQQGFLMTP